jgi:chemotaxis signal transduction protein
MRMRSDAQATRTRAVLAFPVDDVWLGAPMEEVAGVAELTRLVSLPGQREPLEGVVAFRGDVVPTIDLAGLLGMKPRRGSKEQQCAVVLARGTERFGLLIPELPVLLTAREIRAGDLALADPRLRSITALLVESGERRIHCLEYWPLIDAILPPAEATTHAR